MKATSAGVSRKELALITKTLKANPGCVIRTERGPDGERRVRLCHGTGGAAELARLKGRFCGKSCSLRARSTPAVLA
jgi:hypothetical protein